MPGWPLKFEPAKLVRNRQEWQSRNREAKRASHVARERQAASPIERPIDLDAEDRIGPGKIQLLKQIRERGSISAAGRAMDMSYKRAWDLVDEKRFRERKGGLAQFSVCHHAVDEAEHLAAVGVDPFRQEHQLPGARGSDQPGQNSHAMP